MPEKPKQTHNTAEHHGDFIAVGRVSKVHGLTGELKVESLSDIPDRISMLSEVYVEFLNGSGGTFSIASVKARDSGLFVRLEGVEDRTAAEKFRGAYLCIDSSRLEQLPPGDYYEFDLIGMVVRSPAGGVIGTVLRIERYPANDVIVVDTVDGELLVPALKDIVCDVDIDAKRLTMDIPEGLPVYPRGAR